MSDHSHKMLSHVQLFATPWTAAHPACLSTEFSRQEYWSGPMHNTKSCPVHVIYYFYNYYYYTITIILLKTLKKKKNS